MADLILAAGLFTGKPVEEKIVYNEDEVQLSEGAVDEQAAYFMLLPVDGKMDAEYTKLRGQDVQQLRMKPNNNAEGPRVEFDTMEINLSNEREIKAMIWLARKVVKGWRGVMLDDGTELPFSEHNLEKLAAYPVFIKPVLQRAYELGRLRDSLREGN